MTFLRETKHFSGKNGALRCSILEGETKAHKINLQKPTHKRIQMKNVSATNLKHFQLRTIKEVLFIIVSFNIHSRISVWACEKRKPTQFVLNCVIIILRSQLKV